jgi:hypothetical protein
MMSPTVAGSSTVRTSYLSVGAAARYRPSTRPLDHGFGRWLGSVWRTYRSWLVMVPIVLVVGRRPGGDDVSAQSRRFCLQRIRARFYRDRSPQPYVGITAG